MSRYLTVAEVATLWHKPAGTVRWLAHRDRWSRSTDKRRPVLYSLSDVEETMDRERQMAVVQQELATTGHAQNQCNHCGVFRLDGQPPFLHERDCPDYEASKARMPANPT